MDKGAFFLFLGRDARNDKVPIYPLAVCVLGVLGGQVDCGTVRDEGVPIEKGQEVIDRGTFAGLSSCFVSYSLLDHVLRLSLVIPHIGSHFPAT